MAVKLDERKFLRSRAHSVPWPNSFTTRMPTRAIG